MSSESTESHFPCQYCKRILSKKTKYRVHLEQHCGYIQDASSDPAKTAAYVRAMIDDALSVPGKLARGRVCNCRLVGDDFCRRIVLEIDWRKPIIKEIALNGRVAYR